LAFFALPVIGRETPVKKDIIAAGELFSRFNKYGTFDKDGNVDNGAYYNVITEILKSTGLAQRYELKVYPMDRAKRGFRIKKFACFCPGYEHLDNPELQLKQFKLLNGEPLNKAIVRVISKDRISVATKASDISSSDSVSIVKGGALSPDMKKMLNEAGDVVEVDNELQNLKMLSSGRVSKAVVFYPAVIDAYKALRMEQHFPYDKSFSPLVSRDNIICHGSHLEAFKLIESRLEELKESGEIERIMGEAYIIGAKYLDMN